MQDKKNIKDMGNKVKATSIGINEKNAEKMLLIQKHILLQKSVIMKNTATIEFLMDYYIQKEKIK